MYTMNIPFPALNKSFRPIWLKSNRPVFEIFHVQPWFQKRAEKRNAKLQLFTTLMASPSNSINQLTAIH
jgi:hypothetical protein